MSIYKCICCGNEIESDEPVICSNCGYRMFETPFIRRDVLVKEIEFFINELEYGSIDYHNLVAIGKEKDDERFPKADTIIEYIQSSTKQNDFIKRLNQSTEQIREHLNSGFEKKYETIKKIAKDNYSISLLEEAIRERKKGYEVIEDKKVTEFRIKYYQFVRDNYYYLNVKEVKGPAGSKAVWITFDSLKKGTRIQHKADRGYVDLEVSGYGDKAAELLKANKDLLLREGLTVAKANKSAAVRAFVPELDFHKSFEDYIDEMHIICKVIDKMERIVTELNYEV